MSTAPFCPVTRSPPVRPTRLGIDDVNAIAPATDLKSAIAALNRMNNVIQHITRGQPQVNNIGSPGVASPRDPPPQYERMTWTEADRGYRQRAVVNPDDKDQFVLINTISYVRWHERATDHIFAYEEWSGA